jgi:sugar phosphate isomerase/epimerase
MDRLKSTHKASPGRIQLACADFAFPLLPHLVALDVVAALGFQGVDVGFFEGRSHVQPSAALRRPAAAARALRTACEDRGLAIADLFLIPGASLLDLSPNHPEPAIRTKSRDRFERSLAFAQACGAGHFTTIPGMPWPGETRSRSFARCVDEMAWRCDRAAAAGMPFCIEPHVTSIVEKPTQVLALIAEVPSLRIALDPGQFAIQGAGSADFMPLIPFTIHAHARGGCQGNIQAVAAENTIDFPSLVAALNDHGYTGWICLEYVWVADGHCNRVDNLSETILLRDVLRKALQPAR